MKRITFAVAVLLYGVAAVTSESPYLKLANEKRGRIG